MILEEMSYGDISSAKQKFHSEVGFVFLHFLKFLNANKKRFKVPEMKDWNLFLVLYHADKA